MSEPHFPFPLSSPAPKDDEGPQEPGVSYSVVYFYLPSSILLSPKAFQDEGGHVSKFNLENAHKYITGMG